MWEYFSDAWVSPLFVLAGPVMMILEWIKEWRLSDINYSVEIQEVGLDSWQSIYIDDFWDYMKYHFLIWANEQDMSLSILYFIARWCLDVLLMFSIPITFTIDIIPNIIFVIANFVIWITSGVESARYLKLYCIDLMMGMLDYTNW